MREPTVIRWPGKILAGKPNDKLMTGMDLLPTFAKLAGTEAQTDRVLDGIDIRHLFEGKFDQADADRVFHYYFINSLQAVRQGK